MQIKEQDIDKLSAEEAKEALRTLIQINRKLEFRLSQLERALYGRKSERFIPDVAPEQLALSFEGQDPPASSEDITKEKIKYERKKPAHGKAKRQPLPEHLPRKVTVIEPEGGDSGGEKIGVEVTEYLEYTPAEVYVRRIERPKYKVPAKGSENIIIADLPGKSNKIYHQKMGWSDSVPAQATPATR